MADVLMQCELGIKLQPSRYRSDEEKIGYIISHMTGSPQRAFRNHLVKEDKPLFLTDYREFHQVRSGYLR